MPPPPYKKGVKATLHKVFILDAQGGYAGEYALDENCVVEFGDFLAAVPEAGRLAAGPGRPSRREGRLLLGRGRAYRLLSRGVRTPRRKPA